MSYMYSQPHNDDEEEEDDELQRALAMSLAASSAGAATTTCTAATATNNNNTTEQHEDNDDEDAQLARALAMSLEEAAAAVSTAATCTAAPTGAEDKITTKDMYMSVEENYISDSTGISLSLPPSSVTARTLSPIPPLAVDGTKLHVVSSSSSSSSSSPQVYQWVQSATPTDIQSAHQVLWDPTVTVPNDQIRWVAQPILLQEEGAAASTTTTTTTPWGLVQAHGGPCGVLASLQAELLRCLFFGDTDNDNDNDDNDNNDNDNNDVSSSFLLPSGMATARTTTDISTPTTTTTTTTTRHSLSACLAFSMGVILARASLQPSARTETNHDDDETNDNNDETNDKSSTTSPPSRMMMCRLVFPVHSSDTTKKAKVQTDWEDFAPWNNTHHTTNTTDTADSKTPILSEHLVTYTIAVDDDDNDETTTDQEDESHCDRGRRQEALLARAVADFLLATNLLEWYARPGGVLLFVVALILSRTRSRLISDMDDPTSTALTSQFGHSSQELINLLLTGQATSNVFDYTLQPSGDWICRGISQRPTIGYLSLLESLRYVQVGTFYKRPHYPIWVIGSASHFTVLFGDSFVPLHESKSDSILQSVRRAFLQMDGAQDQGFIRTDQWAAFCHKVEGLYEALGHEDAAIQTLGATLEVHGAGILLWEDVWKRTSRLLTGASLQSVLDTEDDWNTTNTNPQTPLPPHAGSSSVAATTGSYYGPSSATATAAASSRIWEPPPLISFASDPLTITATTTVAANNNKDNDDDDELNNNNNNNNNTMSDEDYARMLQAEWNDPGVGGTVTSTTSTAAHDPAAASAELESSSTKPATTMPLNPNNNDNTTTTTTTTTDRKPLARHFACFITMDFEVGP